MEYSKELEIQLLEIYKKYGKITNFILGKEFGKILGTVQQIYEIYNLPDRDKRTKVINCKRCGKELRISRFATDTKFDRFCNDCLIARHNEQYTGIKDYDYVECPVCGFRSRSLEGHFRENAKTWRKCKYSLEEVIERFGNFRIQAKNVDERVKVKRRESGWYKDRVVTIQRMSESAGHLKGKTKETHEGLRKQSETKKKRFASGEIVNWRKGKTKETCSSIALAAEHASKTIQEQHRLGIHGTNALNLTKEQLEVYIDKNKFLNLHKATEELQVCYHTVLRYLDLIKIDYKLKRRSRFFQYYILNRIREITGIDFVEEYKFDDFYKLDKLGRRNFYRFDGYFSELILIVEVHGYQHFDYPNIYHKTYEAFRNSQKVDELKKQKVLEKGLKYISISDIKEIPQKLQQIGIKVIDN